VNLQDARCNNKDNTMACVSVTVWAKAYESGIHKH